MSTDRGVETDEVVHTHDGILLSQEKEIMPFAATWMDLEIIILTEVSHIKKVNYNVILFIFGI